MHSLGRIALVVCLIGAFALNYPIINVPNTPSLTFGVPTLYIYVVSVWLALICAAWAISRAARRDAQDGPDSSEAER
ncbi:MAG: hypothetical protein U0821_07500 [Chloroflexota bacterium]